MTQVLGREKYPFVSATRKACGVLQVLPERVLRRAGLPVDALGHEKMTASPQEHYRIWDALLAEAKRPDMPLFLGKASAHGPPNVAIYAFSCSPNMADGVDRLALFKPLIGPVALTVDKTADALSVSFSSVASDYPMPATFAAFELCYFTELVRLLTSEHVAPISVQMPAKLEGQSDVDAHFGIAAEIGDCAKLVFSQEDADRPFVSADAELWSGFQETLTTKLLERETASSMSARVKTALLAMLPSGQATVEAVCSRLHVSKRSLQRKLKEEGQTFQSILDATRSELSMQYLAQDNISVEEISHLLAFRDPNSFYRAFRGWTGMTPMEARGLQTH